MEKFKKGDILVHKNDLNTGPFIGPRHFVTFEIIEHIKDNKYSIYKHFSNGSFIEEEYNIGKNWKNIKYTKTPLWRKLEGLE